MRGTDFKKTFFPDQMEQTHVSYNLETKTKSMAACRWCPHHTCTNTAFRASKMRLEGILGMSFGHLSSFRAGLLPVGDFWATLGPGYPGSHKYPASFSNKQDCPATKTRELQPKQT